MSTTPTYNVHPRWLPEHPVEVVPEVIVDLQRAVWTDLEDASLLEYGSVVFDHQSYAMYYGVVFGIRDHGEVIVIRWHKGEFNVFDERYTPARIEHAQLWWIDPVMQET